ncbi:MAG: helix-turn-helix transcriptional regulator [Pseudomonadales bacterium]
MLTAILVLRLFAASQVLLFAAALGLAQNPPRIRILGCALAFGVITYLLLPPIDTYLGIGMPKSLALFAQTIPLLLFLFTWELFEDDHPIPSSIWLAGLTYLVAAFWVALQWDRIEDSEIALLALLVQVGKLLFAVGTILLVWRGREHDLVETRAKLRQVFAIGLGSIVAAVVAVELLTGWQVPAVVELAGMTAIFLVTLTINLAFLKINPTFTLVQAHALPTPRTTEDPMIAELTRLMDEERIYAGHDLRIGDIAARMRVPEYQLRRLINQEMGYRNFNQFINRCRIDEAARRLISEPRLPVLTIALDVGFRSISSFNTAFRNSHNCTPSAYRTNAPTGTGT